MINHRFIYLILTILITNYRSIHLLILFFFFFFFFPLFISSLVYKNSVQKKEKDLSQRLENRIERNNSSQLRWIRIEDIPRQAKEAGRISGID